MRATTLTNPVLHPLAGEHDGNVAGRATAEMLRAFACDLAFDGTGVALLLVPFLWPNFEATRAPSRREKRTATSEGAAEIAAAFKGHPFGGLDLPAIEASRPASGRQTWVAVEQYLFAPAGRESLSLLVQRKEPKKSRPRFVAGCAGALAPRRARGRADTTSCRGGARVALHGRPPSARGTPLGGFQGNPKSKTPATAKTFAAIEAFRVSPPMNSTAF